MCDTVSVAPDLLYEHAKKGGICLNGEPDFNLYSAMQRFGTPDEIDDTFRHRPIFSATTLSDNGITGKVVEQLRILRKRYEIYCDHEKLPAKNSNIFPTDVNAAVELLKNKYNVVIGILNGGVAVTNLLASFDHPAAHVEWHHSWEGREPVWKMISGTRDSIKKGCKILLTENDAVSGTTLRKVLKCLDDFSPSSIDVCFSGVEYPKSRDVAKAVGAFNRIMHTTELSQNRFYSNILIVKEAINEKIEK